MSYADNYAAVPPGSQATYRPFGPASASRAATATSISRRHEATALVIEQRRDVPSPGDPCEWSGIDIRDPPDRSLVTRTSNPKLH